MNETPLPSKAEDETRQKALGKYVLLQGIEGGNKFFSSNNGSDPRMGGGGQIWYRVLGYADSVEEAQRALYGRTFPLGNPTDNPT